MPKADGHPAKKSGGHISIRYASGGGYLVTIDSGVGHHCADMNAVIELLRVARPDVPASPGEKISEP